MADFRKLLLALIAGALIFGTAASAQDFACQTSAGPTLVRSEGVADLAGDVKLACGGTLPQLGALESLIVNIRLTLSPQVKLTSKMLDDRKLTEATLVLDGALWADNTRHPKGYAALGSGSTMPLPFADGSQNVYQGLWLSDTEVEWQGVVLVGPGSARNRGGDSISISRNVELTNVRVNGQGLGDGSMIYGQISIQPQSFFAVYGNQNLLLATIKRGLTVSHLGNTIKNCDLLPSGEISFTTTFTEGTGGGSFGSAFRPQLNGRTNAAQHFAVGTGFFDESGYNPVGFAGGGGLIPSGGLEPGSDLVAKASIGLASQGTQFGITLTNIPSGLTFANADVTPTATNGMVVVSNSTTTSGGGATVKIVLEVTGFGAGPTYPAETGQDVVTVVVKGKYTAPPVVGTVTAHGRFLPNSTYDYSVLESVDKVPRFVDSDKTPDTDVITITQSCKTMLLFPYLTTSAGYNSGIAITNSSVDPFGAAVVTGQIQFPTAAYGVTKPQAGACTLYFYGQSSALTLTAAQQAQTINEIPAGGQFITNLAIGAKGTIYDQLGNQTAACDTDGTPANNTCPDMPAFVGYMIANCNFQWAHGFAFVTDTGSDRTMGYLALVIPDRGTGGHVGSPAMRLPQDKGLANNTHFNYNQGEQLGN
jgi:hypothetical protein